MADETDGIEEAFEGQMCVLVSAAGTAGEQLARMRESALRRAQESSEQEARELQSRIEAERRVGRAELGNVHRAEWWDNATPEQIGHAYQVARAWSAEDPEAVRAEQRMRDELRSRYGVDVDATGADVASVRAGMERGERDRAEAAAERTHAVAENAEAQQLMQEADRQDRTAADTRAAAEHEPDPDERVRAAAEAEKREAAAAASRDQASATYDSSQRREATARNLEKVGLDRDLVATRMHADVSQAAPPAKALVDAGRGAVPRARNARGSVVQVQRSGLVR